MKSYKAIMAAVVLLCVNNGFARMQDMQGKDLQDYKMFYSQRPAVMPKELVDNELITTMPVDENSATVMPSDSVAPGSQPVYSFDIILKGVLGEPYTAKVSQIYYSGNSQRANALKRELETAVSSRYQSEQARIDAVKKIIDRY